MTDRPRILVPTDFSKHSMLAIAHAGVLADALGAEIVMMSNLNLPEQQALESFAMAERISIDAAAKNQLVMLAGEHAPGVEATPVVAHFDTPAGGVLAVADSENVDMIVIASHGRSGMTRWLLGSVAEKVARGSGVPVTIVPARG